MSEKFGDTPQLSEEELKNMANRDKSNAELIDGGAQYVNEDGGPRLHVTGEQIESLKGGGASRIEVVSGYRKKEAEQAEFAENPEIAVAERPEVMDAADHAVEERSSESENSLEIARLGAEINELNKAVQTNEVMSRFGREHGFNKDETYSFVEKRVLEDEDRIRQLERNQRLLEQEALNREKLNEIARLKAEIEELNRIVQNSEAMSRFGHDHGFDKEKVYTWIESRVRENEDRIHELEGEIRGEEALEEDGRDGEGGAEQLEQPEETETQEEPEGPETPEEPEGPEIIRILRPLPREAEPVVVEAYESARGKKDWWGWIKERAKGLATFGFWEFHQAERFRSGRKKTAKEIAGSAEGIQQTRNLSEESAFEEADTMRMMAEGAGLESPDALDYENYSRIISGHKIEENNRRIDAIVAESSAILSERLAKYRDEFGKLVALDDRMMSGFEDALRNSLLELQDGQTESDVRRFKEIISGRLDPNYWRRYVYGALETALGALGLHLVLAGLSKWWLGKKAADAGADVIIEHVAPRAAGGAAESAADSAAEAVATDVPMKDHIWRTAREWLQQNGVPNPSDAELMEVSKQVATENGIGVKVWNIPGEPLDTGMQQGHLLKFGGASKILTVIKIARGIASVV